MTHLYLAVLALLYFLKLVIEERSSCSCPRRSRARFVEIFIILTYAGSYCFLGVAGISA